MLPASLLAPFALAPFMIAPSPLPPLLGAAFRAFVLSPFTPFVAVPIAIALIVVTTAIVAVLSERRGGQQSSHNSRKHQGKNSKSLEHCNSPFRKPFTLLPTTLDVALASRVPA